MLKIYFDDVLINEDSYAELNNEYKLFNDSFYLGSTASNTFELKVLKSSVASHPDNVKIDDDTTTFHSIVDKVEEEKGFYNYTLVDKMVNFNFNYDAKPLIDEKIDLEEETYLSDILADMCLKADVELDYVMTNDIIVSWYDSRIQARDYLSFIAELEGGYACINELGKLTIKQHKQVSKKSITADEVSELIIGEKKTITRVVYDGGAFKWEFGDDTGNTLYLNSNNVFITDELVVENIYNKIVGFEFYTITVPNTLIDSSIKAGDVITFVDGDKEYQTIAQYSSSYAGGWVGSYDFNINTEKQEETKILGIQEQVLSIQTEVDRTNASLKITAEKTDEQGTKVSELELNVDGISSSVSALETQTGSAINGLQEEVSQVQKTVFEQVENEFSMQFSTIIGNIIELEKAINGDIADDGINDKLNKIEEYIRFVSGDILLGQVGNEFSLKISKENIEFMRGNEVIAYFSKDALFINKAIIITSQQIGRWITEEDQYGNLNTKWVGDN